MHKTVLTFCTGIFMLFMLVGCGPTPTSGKFTLPTATSRPVGATGITPTMPGKIPAFSRGDVITYVNMHNIPFNIAPLSGHGVEQVLFITSKELNVELNRQNTRIPDNYLLCVVTFSGRFIFPAPPVPNRRTSTAPVTYQRAFEVFDAITGNLLMGGGLTSQFIPLQ